jgi:hypothetical protein
VHKEKRNKKKKISFNSVGLVVGNFENALKII